MIHTLAFRAMGCQMLAALDSDSPQADRRLASAPGWFETWEQSLSRFRSNSELSELNRSPGQDWKASQTLWDVFQVALSAEKRSQGLVTPRVLPALIESGYDRDFASLEDHGPQNGGSAHAALPGVVSWNLSERTIQLSPGTGLDFGGVAKGWAAQQAVRKLRAYGPASVDAGGDIAVSGRRMDGQPWPVGVADPHQPDLDLGVIHLAGGGVATSGIDHRRWKQGGAWKHHIIDPRSGEPAETDLLSVTVAGQSVMEAEMAAKMTLILGSQAGFDWLSTQAGLEGLLVLQNKQQLCTAHFWN